MRRGIEGRRKLRVSDLGAGVLVLIAVIIMAARPFSADLSDTAQIMLGGILITLAVWIFKPFDLTYSVGGMFLACFSLAIGLSPSVVFSGFTQPAIWTLVPALFFGFVLQKTGLGVRIAMGIIKLIRPSYTSLVLALVLVGTVLSILTPSITVRVAIITPIAVQCSELCRLTKGSKGNSLILLTAFAVALIPGSGWLSGSLWGPIISGMINATPGTEGLITFNNWFSVIFLPTVIITVLLVAGSLVFLKPKEKLSKDAIGAIKSQPLKKMSRHELISIVVLVAVFAMFLTGRFHGIPDAAVCLAAVVVFFATGVLETKDVNNGISWDLVLFFSFALGLGAIFTETGISRWLAGIIVPALAPIAGNPWLFTFGIMIVMFLWRFFDIAVFIPTIAIMVPILPAIQEAYAVSPLIWIAVFVMPANCFFMAYQNMWAMMNRSIAGDRAWENKHLSIYGVMYFAACMISLIPAVPMWISAGLFG